MKIDKKQAGMWFSLGLVIGALLVGLWFRFGHRHHRHRWDPDRALQRFSARLDLDEKQQEKVRKILVDKGEQHRAIHKDHKKRADAVRETFRGEIEKLLRTDQAEKFEKMKARWDERRRQRRKRRH
ncbi:MAG: hypothetical protein IIA14_03150 [SAR324 cluster bacterium]|nr:hypothetical protein [SAR324 cluster bacterium]